MKLDNSLLPNLQEPRPGVRRRPYDPTGDYNVVKDYGITMFFYQQHVVKPRRAEDDARLLRAAAEVRQKGRTNLLDGAEEVVPLALDGARARPEHRRARPTSTRSRSSCSSIRNGVTTISSSNYINDASAGKIILGQGWNGDVRRIVAGPQEAGRHHRGDPDRRRPRCGPTTGASRPTAPHPVAAHAWINCLLDRRRRGHRR